MQIKKINNNILEVLINIEDLNKNNISWNNFMSTSIKKQDLYTYILNNAYKTFGFKIDNCKIKVDSFAIISKRIFVLVITRIPKYICIDKKYKNNTFFIAKFKNFNNLAAFCSIINPIVNSSLYYYKRNYYLKINILHMHDFKKVFFNLKEFADDILPKFLINENAELIINKNAIEICKKFI